MSPSKAFLGPKHQFLWNAELEDAFQSSERAIVDAIQEGVQIFVVTKTTSLRPDWSTNAICYFLLQKQCCCESDLPDCCADGCRVVLAGSRFLSSAEL